ncbi:MAG: HAMP domain-containing histidine kinase [Bacteroidales bacterium]|nr:HAMP domain-containing histidine kinase [Bacteroidales bacterium]
MKLLVRTTIYMVFFNIILFITGGILFYYVFKSYIYRQIDNNLMVEMQLVRDEILHSDTLPDIAGKSRGIIHISLSDKPVRSAQVFVDTVLKTPGGDEVTYRYLKFLGNKPDGTGYFIGIFHSLEERKELLQVVTLYIFFLIITLLVFAVLMNYFVSRKLWSSFYKTLKSLREFDLSGTKKPLLWKSNITEFQELNKVLDEMMDKMILDFNNVKDFTNYASHEIRTPLAVISSKTEILMQAGNLTEDQMRMLIRIQESALRLTRINQGLLIISKIDNYEYAEKKEVFFGRMIDEYLDKLEDMLEGKSISITREYTGEPAVQMHPALAELLVINLLSNAIKHNIDHGIIEIVLSENSLSIRNTGSPLSAPPEEMFEKFRKESAHSESLGLGLSIVKKIVDFYRLGIEYTCSGSLHHIVVHFTSQEKKLPDES